MGLPNLRMHGHALIARVVCVLGVVTCFVIMDSFSTLTIYDWCLVIWDADLKCEDNAYTCTCILDYEQL